MRVLALISGGKDSCFNMMHCIANGHTIVALANLKPADKDELDSYMFQTVGHDVIQAYADTLGLPLFRRTITGSSVCTDSAYTKDDSDEVEDLYQLVKEVREQVDFNALSSGAILSNYQRVRVENVCRRLDLQSLGYLWQRNQEELLDEMIEAQLEAVLIKVAALGLKPIHLGKTLSEMKSYLHTMKSKYELNVCGEGGEYETITLDCPLFSKKIIIDEKKIVLHSDDAFAPVAFLKFNKIHLEDKGLDPNLTLSQRMLTCRLRKPELFKDAMLEYFPRTDSMRNNLTIGLKVNNSPAEVEKSAGPRFHSANNKAWLTDLVCIQDGGNSLEESTLATMKELETLVNNNSYRLGDVALVHLFCASMADFAKINSVYKNFFVESPPARVCVEICLPKKHVFKMDVCLDKSHTRTALHVESISYWAPANIGPYSQVVRVGSLAYFSGSIGMDPSSLLVVDGGIESEAGLALNHVNEISKILIPNRKSHRDHGLVNCYITDQSKTDYISNLFKCQEMFDSTNYILNVVCVPRLPKGALVEWHVLCSWDEEAEGDICVYRDDNLKFNLNFFKLTISSCEFQNNDNLHDVLLHSFNQYNFLLNKGEFLRVYYLAHMFDDNNIENAFRTSLLHVINDTPAISFVPVCGFSRDKLIVVTGCMCE